MKVNVIRSALIDAPIERVWKILRDFNSHELWHPAVSSSGIENGLDGDVVGCVRRFTLIDHSEFREQLLRHNDSDYSFSYAILDSSRPLFEHVATVRLKPVTDGNMTFWDWRSQFEATNDSASELEDFVGRDLFEAGFKGLRSFLAERTIPFAEPVVKVDDNDIPITAGEAWPSRAVVIKEAGDPDGMDVETTSVPKPNPRQVRIRQTVIAVNVADIEYRRGLTSKWTLPGTPGLEGVGEILDVGRDVNGLFPGDRVACMTRTPGAYTEIRCIDAGECLPLPAGVSDVEASMLLKGVTASLLLGRVFRATAGGTILICSVAGGLGHLLSQWAKALNLTVIGTVSTPDQAKFVRDLGCDYPIVLTENKRLPDEVTRITSGRGVDYVVDDGRDTGFEEALACLSRCGHLAVLGNREGTAHSFDVNALRRKSLTVSAPMVFDFLDDKVYIQRLAHQLFSKIQAGTIIPVIETIPLDQAAEAHRKVESRQSMGAVVLITG